MTENRSELHEIAKILADSKGTQGVSLVQGTVDSVAPWFALCTVNIGGTLVPDLRWFKGAPTPEVGDSVWMIRNGTSDLFILGSIHN
jgi:hypothetical protein